MIKNIGNYLYRTLEAFCAPTSSPALQKSLAFGSYEWKHYLDRDVKAPPLPQDLETLMQSPCPFWPDKCLEETHLLCLIPEGISALDLMEKAGFSASERKEYPELALSEVENRWILLTKCVITSCCILFPTAENRRIASDKHLLTPYRIPYALEVMVAILALKHLQNITLYQVRGEQTLCQEMHQGNPVILGGDPFSSFYLPTIPNEVNGIVGVYDVTKKG
ncbi:MAG: hypothetical protein QRY71_04280 [Candidatus Rhabdochlamydia sp.]